MGSLNWLFEWYSRLVDITRFVALNLQDTKRFCDIGQQGGVMIQRVVFSGLSSRFLLDDDVSIVRENFYVNGI